MNEFPNILFINREENQFTQFQVAMYSMPVNCMFAFSFIFSCFESHVSSCSKWLKSFFSQFQCSFSIAKFYVQKSTMHTTPTKLRNMHKHAHIQSTNHKSKAHQIDEAIAGLSIVMIETH